MEAAGPEAAPRTRLLELQAAVRARRAAAPEGDIAEEDALRARAAAAFDQAARQAPLRSGDVEPQLLRPPWASGRLRRRGRDEMALSVAEAREALVARSPAASSLLEWLELRSGPLDPYRRSVFPFSPFGPLLSLPLS